VFILQWEVVSKNSIIIQLILKIFYFDEFRLPGEDLALLKAALFIEATMVEAEDFGLVFEVPESPK